MFSVLILYSALYNSASCQPSGFLLEIPWRCSHSPQSSLLSYGSIACFISRGSCDSDDQGHDYHYQATQASSSRSSYGTIITQPTYQPHPSPSCTQDSYKAPTVSDRERNSPHLNRISPPRGGQCPGVTSHFGPLAVRAFTFPEFPTGFFPHLVFFLWRSAACQ